MDASTLSNLLHSFELDIWLLISSIRYTSHLEFFTLTHWNFNFVFGFSEEHDVPLQMSFTLSPKFVSARSALCCEYEVEFSFKLHCGIKFGDTCYTIICKESCFYVSIEIAGVMFAYWLFCCKGWSESLSYMKLEIRCLCIYFCYKLSFLFN